MSRITQLAKEIITPGNGPVVQAGMRTTVHATGNVRQPGGALKKFWSTRDPGQQPFQFNAGKGEVIAGWDQGVLGMKVGEKANIMIPANMGYGSSGFPAWGIPPDADLCFEIEVLQTAG
ncbi:unnamed protein product [Vitrella brassicaformis CCMP3155]|uniref:peptidylprolyl isomerase n=1 Tax=Vitrella brassicaformis (strain CCMP3155) TaxID=1169540 RepID=A0A0G4G8R1_VITBC|nr:unnamed protein product [Vitrella brassicaformis CCMP3155]|mmetsp:Transcript_26836/g.66837  ORF Transcript_26836/g.66837 Transcript_26836/m.66837 type:complete len:119 (+) Transcript_26836:3020-3376(+)|eukprot:CEM25102.1 unnamed protein product [Vitrella brassicaformis CCMP3155]